jgi:ribonuclease HII
MDLMISGIDEAGKGPVLGPMCVAGILLEETKINELVRIKVKDSKQLTAEKREVLEGEIKEIAEEYFILEVSASRIDELRKIMTMNEIMVISYTKVLEELRPDHVFVDAADVNEDRFGENIRKRYSRQIIITSKHKADIKYPIVSAASILAKVQRDLLVKQLGDELGMEIGSGYPADQTTIQFLENWVQENNSLPSFARSSWETSKRILEKFNKNQKTLFQY